MSWDLWLSVTDAKGDELEIDSWNYTHNTNGMIREAGFDGWWGDAQGMTGEELAHALRPVVETLRSETARFDAMNPANKWGSRESLVEVLASIVDIAERWPHGRVEVHG